MRIRNTGKLRMEFDINGAQTVYVGYAVIPIRSHTDWQLWMSTNGGNTYKQVGATVTVDSRELQKVAFDVKQQAMYALKYEKLMAEKQVIDHFNCYCYNNPVAVHQNSPATMEGSLNQ